MHANKFAVLAKLNKQSKVTVRCNSDPKSSLFNKRMVAARIEEKKASEGWFNGRDW